MSGIDEGDPMTREQVADFVRILTKVAGVGVHEHGNRKPIVLCLYKFMLKPLCLLCTNLEIRTAGAGADDVQKQAAVAIDRCGLGQSIRAQGPVISIQRSWFEVMVARNDVSRDR